MSVSLTSRRVRSGKVRIQIVPRLRPLPDSAAAIERTPAKSTEWVSGDHGNPVVHVAVVRSSSIDEIASCHSQIGPAMTATTSLATTDKVSPDLLREYQPQIPNAVHAPIEKRYRCQGEESVIGIV